MFIKFHLIAIDSVIIPQNYTQLEQTAPGDSGSQVPGLLQVPSPPPPPPPAPFFLGQLCPPLSIHL